MSDLFYESEILKKAISGVAKEVIDKETSSCFRVYKAIVVSPKTYDAEKGFVCGVRLVGDDTVLYLPLSSATSNAQVGDTVWVATIANSFRNAIVWENRFFQEQNVTPKHYGARWDKTVYQMTRLYDAESFPSVTTNFCYLGSVNENYDNPFDGIYPWSEIKLCNIDIEIYMNLTAGQSITESVVAWEGDPDFSYDHPYGVWRYRPGFYGKSWEDDTYRYFDVCESDLGGYIYYHEDIAGRWQGVSKQIEINGQSQTVLLPLQGITAGRSYDARSQHLLAKNYGATVDSIYTFDADLLLMIVEYATMNVQYYIGNGVTLLNYQPSTTIQENIIDTNVIRLPASPWQTYCIPGAVLVIGDYPGTNTVGTFYVVSATLDPQDSSYINVTINDSVTATTSQYLSIQGLMNQADAQIGSKSGYIGTNGYCNSYYRGIVMYGNGILYILGIYKDGSNQSVWIAKDNKQADQYDDLDQSAHISTGLSIPLGSDYIKELGIVPGNYVSIPPICTEFGGTYLNPVGDYVYNSDGTTQNKILFIGGSPSSGGAGGPFCQFWAFTNNTIIWYITARPRLMPVSEGG